MIALDSEIILNASNFANFSYMLPYIRYCNEDKFTSQWHLKKRTIQDYELILVVEGNGQFKIEDRTYFVKPNDLILLSPDIPHEAKSETQKFSQLCMHFDIFVSSTINLLQLNTKRILEAIPSEPVKYSRATLEMPEFMASIDAGYIQQLFRRIVIENEKRETGYNGVMKSLFMELLYTVFRQMGKHIHLEDMPDEIRQAAAYIKQNFFNKITLPDISSHVHLQSAYFSTLFKKYMGLSFTEYLKLQRLAEAKNILLVTDRKIEDISTSIGFYDVHHFCRIFRQYEGLTPGQYRKIRHR